MDEVYNLLSCFKVVNLLSTFMTVMTMLGLQFFFSEVKDLSGIATAIRCLTVCLVSLRSSLET